MARSSSSTNDPKTGSSKATASPSSSKRASSSGRLHWNSALAGALISAIVLGGVAFLWRRPTPPPITIYAPPAPVAPTPEPPAAPAPLVIFISGAVQTPGVYELPGGARAADALERAGGFTADANVNAINQAALLRDGDQIYVPTLEEEPAAPPPGLSSVEPAAGSENGLININTASLAELDLLPGVGPSRAQDIIDNRPYESVDDLERVPGIGAVTIEELRPLVVVE